MGIGVYITSAIILYGIISIVIVDLTSEKFFLTFKFKVV